MATTRLEGSTAWCPVQSHSCGAQERVALAAQDGVDSKETLAKRVKVTCVCITTMHVG